MSISCNKALQWFELVQKPEEIDSIFVKSDYKLVQVDLKKIMYIEGLKDYIKIYTEDAPKPILSLMSMKAMEELLPSSRFIRVHRSFVVQKDKKRVICIRQDLYPYQRQLQAGLPNFPRREELMFSCFIGKKENFVDYSLSEYDLCVHLHRTEKGL